MLARMPAHSFNSAALFHIARTASDRARDNAADAVVAIVFAVAFTLVLNRQHRCIEDWTASSRMSGVTTIILAGRSGMIVVG